MTLTDIANKLGLDKGTEHHERHSYTLVYEKILEQYRDKHIKLLEIGINDPRYENSSVHLWSEYFDDLYCVGFDIKDCSKFNSDKVHTFQGDQGSVEDLNALIAKFGGDYDVIIDDGSHFHKDHMISFNVLFEYVKPGGYYIVEDLHAYGFEGYLTSEKISEMGYECVEECARRLLIVKKPAC